jgi:hypothetical protein
MWYSNIHFEQSYEKQTLGWRWRLGREFMRTGSGYDTLVLLSDDSIKSSKTVWCCLLVDYPVIYTGNSVLELCRISSFGINTFKSIGYFMHHHQVWCINVYLLSCNAFVFCYGSQNSEYFVYSIKWLVFETQMDCTYCAVRIESSNFIRANFRLQNVMLSQFRTVQLVIFAWLWIVLTLCCTSIHYTKLQCMNIRMDKMVRWLEENIKQYAWGEALKMTLYRDFLIQILTKSEEA